jgi:hypothetical protein
VNDTTITAVVPSGTTVGAVNVVVTTSIGSGTGSALYSYAPTTGPAPAPVPTLSDWGMAGLALGLIAAGGWKLRSRIVA